MSWIRFDVEAYRDLSSAPYDGIPFLCKIWGSRPKTGDVMFAIFVRSMDLQSMAEYGMGHFKVWEDPEIGQWTVKLDQNRFPITHWMPIQTTIERIIQVGNPA